VNSLSSDKANTPEEVVDVVDEKDEVIGTATKGEVNSNPKLIHREVAVLIYDENARIYVQQRSPKKKTHPLQWIVSVAGHVPSKMSPEEAAYKELREEMGIKTDLEFWYKRKSEYAWEAHFVYIYIGRYPKKAEIVLDKNETVQGRFVNKEELLEMEKGGEKIVNSCKEIFDKFWSRKI
jgi:isopentenyl-diphosphate delta-isomerase type 1